MHDVTGAVGGNLRRLRARAGLSAVELARRAGVGRATLTQLEAGHGNPTLETLYALATVLGVPLGELLALPEPGVEPRVVRRGEGPRTAGEVVAAHLLRRSRWAACTVEVYAVALCGTGTQHSAAHTAGTREHVHLHRGRVRVGPTGAPVDLGAGDYADYAADVPHVYRCLSVEPGEGTLTIVTPDEGRLP